MQWWIPTYDARVCSGTCACVLNEQQRSRSLLGFGFLEHYSPQGARAKATEALDGDGPEAVLMLDDDQAVLDRPDSPSWVDGLVAQYLDGDPYRLLYGATAVDQTTRQFNLERAADGSIEWIGTGLVFIGRLPWRRLRERYPTPWWITDAADIGRGEDVIFARRCRDVGIGFELAKGLTIAHWPRWRHAMVAQTDLDGRVTLRASVSGGD